MVVDVEYLKYWLVRYGELVTMVVRVLRECSGLCCELSLKYLTMLLGLDIVKLCRYLNYGLVDECLKELSNVCSEYSGKVGTLVSVSRRLSEGEFVLFEDLTNLLGVDGSDISGIYLCLSRLITQNLVVSGEELKY